MEQMKCKIDYDVKAEKPKIKITIRAFSKMQCFKDATCIFQTHTQLYLNKY